MVAQDLCVDRLTDEDLPAAYSLSQAEGWSTHRADWRRMIELDAVDALAGRLDADLVATATVVRYGTSVAWVGMMLVDRSHRRRGYGTTMLDASLETARQAGMDVIGLDANAAGKPLYDQYDFVRVGETVQWKGHLPAGASPNRVEPLDDSVVVAAMDRDAVGVDREFLLDSLLTEAENKGLLARDDSGEPAGFAILRPREESWSIGPLIACTPAAATSLLSAAAGRVGDDPVTINVVDNQLATQRYESLGLQPQRTLARMTYREASEPLMGTSVWAMPAFEYG